MHLCIGASTHEYIYAVLHLRMYACMHVCMYAYMYTCRQAGSRASGPSLLSGSLCPAMALPDASRLGATANAAPLGTPDASTLGATAFNVGMLQVDSFGNKHSARVNELAGYVKTWLEDGPAVVGLNEIAPNIAEHLVERLQQHHKFNVGIATHQSNSVMWRNP